MQIKSSHISLNKSITKMGNGESDDANKYISQMKNIKVKTPLLTIGLLILVIPFYSIAQKVPTTKKQTTKPNYFIDLYPAFKSSQTYPLSLVAESTEYIALEKTDDCLLGEHISGIYFDDNSIFVFDFNNCFRFTRDGKFVNKIGKKGRGPGEYNRPMHITLDKEQNAIYIQDKKRILKYGYNGDFLEEFLLGITTSNILHHKDDIFLVNRMMYSYAPPNDRFSIYFFSTDKKKHVARFKCPKKDKIPFAIDNPIMYNYNKNTFIKDYWGDNIFKVEDPHNVFPYATLNTGKLKHRDKDDKRPFTGKKNKGDELVVSITFISETDRYIFMGSNKGLFIFDKKNNITYCSKYQKNGEKWSGFTNDITGGPTFFAHSFPKYHFSENSLTTFNFPYEFFEEGVNTNNPQIKELLKTLQPDDNPVIVLVKLKE